jgi:hypothetical protein
VYYVSGFVKNDAFSAHKRKCYLNVLIDTESEVQLLPIDVYDENLAIAAEVSPLRCNKLGENWVTKTKKRKLSCTEREKREKAGKLWHRRTAHASSPYIHKMSTVCEGMDPVICSEKLNTCEGCAFVKLTRKHFDKDRDSATCIGQIIHADNVGPITPETYHTKNRYILVVLDDYFRYLQTFVMKTRDETPEMLDSALCEIQARYPGSGQFDRLRCDKGGEFESTKLLQILHKYGIEPQYAKTAAHKHNSCSERVIRTLEEKIRALLYKSGFSQSLWGQLTDTATWLYNRIPHSAIDMLTPYELFFNKAPNVAQLCVIGSKCCVYDPKIPRGRKWDFCSSTHYLIGYTPTGYRVFNANTGVTSDECILTINESQVYKDDYPIASNEVVKFSFPLNWDNQSPTCLPVLSQMEEAPTPVVSGGGVIKNNNRKSSAPVHSGGGMAKRPYPPSKPVTRSTTKRQKEAVDPVTPKILNTMLSTATTSDQPIDFHTFGQYDKDLYTSKIVPITYDEAMREPLCSKWYAPIQKELKAFHNLNVFTPVPRTRGLKPVPVKWIFTVKADGTPKARIVAVGCRDQEKYSKEEIASPTPHSLSVRWFLAVQVRLGWFLKHIDIDNAFLNGDIDREKFISLPIGTGGV